MKSLFSKYVWLQLILSILLLFGGALIVVFAALNKETILVDGLNIIAAVICFIFGLFAILASFAFEQNKAITNGLVYGSASIAFGVFLCIKEFVLVNYLVYLLAIFFIVIGAVELIEGIIMAIRKFEKKFIIVLTFIFAALFITGGILAIIYREQVRLVFCFVAGVLLMGVGIFLMVMGIKAMVEQSKVKTKPVRKTKPREPKKKDEIKELDYTKTETEVVDGSK